VKEGFDSYLSICNATEEDLRGIKMKKGHQVAAIAAVREFQASQGGGPLSKCVSVQQSAPAVSQQHPDPLARLQDLGLLGVSQQTAPVFNPTLPGGESDQLGPRANGLTPTPTPARMDLDPTVFLQSKGEQSHLKIVDFLTYTDTCAEQDIEVGGGVSIRLPRQKLRLEVVTQAQWIVANSRIMATLIQTGQLGSAGTMDYLSYTVKIGELAGRFTWQSVLLYDDQYRRTQAAYGFRWGSDSQHLYTVTLRERSKPGRHQEGHRAGSTATRPGGHGDREVCQQWNRGRCTFAPRCRFQHVCSVCFRPDHTVKDHSAGEAGLSTGKPPAHQSSA
jgi:hypothetical protein